ncbi:MAG: penicillin-binding protein activator [candidate division Zixibacteria bacterium]|nr:penicillin-binding protein activator [candidate division Zixibacteria bacterium]
MRLASLRRVTLWLVAILLLAMAASYAVTDQIDPPEATSEFAKGKRLLREGDWWGAASTFERLAGQYPQSTDLDQFVFHRAKAKYYLGELSDAIAGFSHFLTKFPNSPEQPHARFFLANAFYRKGDIDRALDQYMAAYGTSRDSQLDQLLIRSVTALFQNAGAISIDEQEFDELSSDKKCRLVKPLLPILMSHDQIATAKTFASHCDETLDLTQYRTEVRNRNKALEVAMLLPLSGDLQSYGEDIYNGAVIAAEIMRDQSDSEIRIVPYDTKGNPIDAARIIGEFTHSAIDAVIGPLTSEAAAVASARLGRSDIPLLIPAATQAGLTLLSESSFQLSPNIELEGIRMAEYAVSVLEADSTALITSTSAEHLHSSRAFVRRFEELGGTIVAVEYYRSRDKDFGPYIRDIKAILLGATPDSAFYVNARGDTIDVDGLPAYIDCLYLPGGQKQIRLLLPQIHFYNLTGAYLGSDQWGEESIYRLGDDITKQAVFPSPFLTGGQTEGYLEFAAAYDARYGEQPRRLANLGYDALTLIGRAHNSGAENPLTVSEYLKTVRNYDGASGKVSFGSNRENVEMPLYRIVGGEAIPMVSDRGQVSDTTD